MSASMNAGLLLAQTTACLALGVLFSYILVRRPAKAHLCLLIGMAAVAFLPGLHAGVQNLGLGLLKTKPQTPFVQPIVMEKDPATAVTSFAYIEPDIFLTDSTSVFEVTENPLPQPGETIKTIPPTVSSTPKTLPWRTTGLTLWALTACVMLMRLVIQFVIGFRLIRHSKPVQDTDLIEAFERARNRLNIKRPVTLCTSDRINSPVIWCWHRVPILLIKLPTTPNTCQDWSGVFCHELAHLKRADHITNLWADLMCTALPWHPLTWWTRQRLLRLSEDICDDWALVHESNTTYAHALLNFTTQKQLAIMPSIIGKERPMKARIKRIVQGRFTNPLPGHTWTCAVVLLAVCLTVGMALAQPESRDPIREVERREEPARGVIARTEALDMGRIGRLNILNRLLEQLTDQIREAEKLLESAQNDSDKRLRDVELDTLREQASRIEEQIRNIQTPPQNRIAQSQSLNNTNERPVRQNVPRAYATSQSRRQASDQPIETQRQQRMLEIRRKQIQEELQELESQLKMQVEYGILPRDAYQQRIRPLRNELEMIEAELKETRQEIKVFRLQYTNASRITGILSQTMPTITVACDEKTNSIMISGSPDMLEQAEALLKSLDIENSGNRQAATRTASRTTRTPQPAWVATTSPDTRTTSSQNLNTEVQDLRNQVNGLNQQMTEIRHMLQLMLEQKQKDTDNPPNVY